MLSAAKRGVAEVGSGLSRLSFAIELSLISRDEQLAFCALYGAWLGGGSVACDGQLTVSARTAVDARLLEQLLHTLRRALPRGPGGWIDGQRSECGETSEVVERCDHSSERATDAAGRVFVIEQPRWFRYFASQCADESAPAGSVRRQTRVDSLPASPSPSPRSLVSLSTTSTDSQPSSPTSHSAEHSQTDSHCAELSSDEDSDEEAESDSRHKLPASLKQAVDQPRSPLLSVESLSTGKQLWRWVLACCDDRDASRAILEGYRQLSGSVAVGSGPAEGLLLTHSTSLRDDLLLLCLHAGYTASFRLHGADASCWAVCYSGDAQLTAPVLRGGRDIQRRVVEGRVWCVTVAPHHLVLARSVLERSAAGVVVRASRPVVVGQCYQNALKKDPQNVQILKDLSQLQIQRRMADGYCETRRQLLLLKTNNRGNWLAYAVGQHLAGRHSKAIDILDSFMRTQDTEDDSGRRKKAAREREEAAALRATQSADELRAEVQKQLAAFHARSRVRVSFEDSELHLYRVALLSQSGQWQAALDCLEEAQEHIADSLCYLDNRAMLLLELGRTVEAEQHYRALLNVNADNASYHRGLHRSLGLSATARGDSERLQALYAELRVEYPKSALVRRLPLDFSHDAAFASLVAQHMKRFIRKAIPSLFADLRPLYSDARKVQQIGDIVESFVAQLASRSRFDDEEGTGESEEESPSCLLWTHFFAAQHYDHLGQPRSTAQHSTHATACPHSGHPIDWLSCLRRRSAVAPHTRILSRVPE